MSRHVRAYDRGWRDASTVVQAAIHTPGITQQQMLTEYRAAIIAVKSNLQLSPRFRAGYIEYLQCAIQAITTHRWEVPA